MNQEQLKKRLLAISAALSLGLGFTSNAIALDMTVDTTEDQADNTADCTDAADAGTACSLREAIGALDGSQESNIIRLGAETYALTIAGNGGAGAGDLDILMDVGGSVTIQGEGADATIIDAGGNNGILDRIFEFQSGDALTLSKLTLRGGYSYGNGGAVNQIGGILDVVDCRISANSALYGGGIAADSDASVSLLKSEISGNRAANGAGMNLSQASLSITQSLIEGNVADQDGGGIIFFNGPGKLAAVLNSTITGNQAGRHAGAFYQNDGFAAFVQATITNNLADANGDNDGFVGGLALLNGGMALKNSILAANLQNATPSDCSIDTGSITSFGNNIVGTDATCGAVFDASDHVGSLGTELVPGLEFLADNGGFTRTHALTSDSPAVGLSDCASELGTIFEDQRGSLRPDANCDSGAYQRSVCGDSILAIDEACDDGNVENGDGCSAECQIETPDSGTGGETTGGTATGGTGGESTVGGSEQSGGGCSLVRETRIPSRP